MHNLKGVINEPEYAGFKIYVTGHSLGGALSTLFSFQLAAEATKEGSNIPTPISNISIASPYVGDDRFRKSFMVSRCDIKFHCMNAIQAQDSSANLLVLYHAHWNIDTYIFGKCCRNARRKN